MRQDLNFLAKPLAFLLLVTYVFLIYKPFLLEGKLPIPADTIVGLYHPWRDAVSDKYPQGIVYKNFQITDAVRQQYPWRNLAIESIRAGQVPGWNPYNFSGSPLLANFQTAVFYPLNILFFLLDFASAWGILVFLQTVLGLIFMYLLLRHWKLGSLSSAIGSLSWVGSGFFVAWLEWNTTVHVALWLPLILLSIDQIVSGSSKKYFWILVHFFSLTASFLAGYLQPFVYVLLLSLIYLVVKLYQARKFSLLWLFLISHLSFLILTVVQWLPTLRFILLSARNLDQANWQRPDWFLPWGNLVQLFAPDYFGNPATLNYFGVWNYQEFVAYVGSLPLLLALYALINGRTRFWAVALLLALVFALPTPLAKIPYFLNLPFISTAQPSRIIVLVDFALAVLAAFGWEKWQQNNFRDSKFVWPILTVFFVLFGLGMVALRLANETSLRNLVLPTGIWLVHVGAFAGLWFLGKYRLWIVTGLVLLLVFDLWRFFYKFTPFSSRDYLYPPTQIVSFLQDKARTAQFRLAALDDRILPPNFSVAYRLQTISGYDPLYLARYGELVQAVERGKPDISGPLGFNRIITPKRHDGFFFDLTGVRYVLSFEPVKDPKFKLVMTEGQTRLWENKNALPRAFFAEKIYGAKSKQAALERLFDSDFDPAREAVVEGLSKEDWPNGRLATGSASIAYYATDRVVVQTKLGGAGFLVLSDNFYPGWKAWVDGKETPIYLTDYTFRGVKVAPFTQRVIFEFNYLND